MLVLDTHAWIWWASSPERLSKRARSAIDEGGDLMVPAICCWEVAMLVARGRVELDRDTLLWIRQALALSRILMDPITPEIAVRSAALEEVHGDPADRLIIATALQRRAALVSKDGRVRSCGLVDTIW